MPAGLTFNEMYMGRKANPVANKLLYEAEVKKQQEAHKRRIAAMKPSLDTKPPPEHRHLYRNAKKEQVMEGKFMQRGRAARRTAKPWRTRPWSGCSAWSLLQLDTTAHSTASSFHCTVGTKPSTTFSILAWNPLTDRYAKIEHENRLLLTKMSDIMTRRGAVDNVSTAWQYGRSLNRSTRARELRRITEENLRILHRIQTVEPMYDHAKWEEERMRQERLVDSICEFKRGRGAGGGSSAAFLGAGGGSMYSARSRSMGPLGSGTSLGGGEGYEGVGGSSAVLRGEGYDGVGGSGSDEGAVSSTGAYPTGSAALSSYHAEAGLSGPMAGGSGWAAGGAGGGAYGGGGAPSAGAGYPGHGSSALAGAGSMSLGGYGSAAGR